MEEPIDIFSFAVSKGRPQETLLSPEFTRWVESLQGGQEIEQRVTILAFVGYGRDGKSATASTLVSHILGQAPRPHFASGEDYVPETKGLQMFYCRGGQDNQNMIILDCEGLNTEFADEDTSSFWGSVAYQVADVLVAVSRRGPRSYGTFIQSVRLPPSGMDRRQQHFGFIYPSTSQFNPGQYETLRNHFRDAIPPASHGTAFCDITTIRNADVYQNLFRELRENGFFGWVKQHRQCGQVTIRQFCQYMETTAHHLHDNPALESITIPWYSDRLARIRLAVETLFEQSITLQGRIEAQNLTALYTSLQKCVREAQNRFLQETETLVQFVPGPVNDSRRLIRTALSATCNNHIRELVRRKMETDRSTVQTKFSASNLDITLLKLQQDAETYKQNCSAWYDNVELIESLGIRESYDGFINNLGTVVDEAIRLNGADRIMLCTEIFNETASAIRSARLEIFESLGRKLGTLQVADIDDNVREARKELEKAKDVIVKSVLDDSAVVLNEFCRRIISQLDTIVDPQVTQFRSSLVDANRFRRSLPVFSITDIDSLGYQVLSVSFASGEHTVEQYLRPRLQNIRQFNWAGLGQLNIHPIDLLGEERHNWYGNLWRASFAHGGPSLLTPKNFDHTISTLQSMDARIMVDYNPNARSEVPVYVGTTGINIHVQNGWTTNLTTSNDRSLSTAMNLGIGLRAKIGETEGTLRAGANWSDQLRGSISSMLQRNFQFAQTGNVVADFQVRVPVSLRVDITSIAYYVWVGYPETIQQQTFSPTLVLNIRVPLANSQILEN